MLEPLNIWRYIGKNYYYIHKDYKLIPLIFSFFVLPLVIAILLISFLDSSSIGRIIVDSLIFFSIIIGFLINVLVLILNKKDKFKDLELEGEVDKLKKHLGFNIINAIVFGVLLVVLILFYGEYELITNIRGFSINISEFFTLFLSTHFVMLLLNIVRKFGVYVETITKDKIKIKTNL